MFPDSSIQFRLCGLVGVYTKRIFRSKPFTQDDNSRNIHDKIINKLFLASITRNKTRPEKNVGVG